MCDRTRKVNNNTTNKLTEIFFIFREEKEMDELKCVCEREKTKEFGRE